MVTERKERKSQVKIIINEQQSTQQIKDTSEGCAGTERTGCEGGNEKRIDYGKKQL